MAEKELKPNMKGEKSGPNLGQKEARAEKKSEDKLHHMGDASPQPKERKSSKDRPAEK